MDRIHGPTASAYSVGLMTALFGGITVQEVAIWVGILCTVGTFVVNSYYKWKEDARQEKRWIRDQGIVNGSPSDRGTVHSDSTEDK